MTALHSIRGRLLLQLVGIAALLSLAFFLIVRAVAEQAAEGTQDDILLASATAIADSLRSENGEVTLDLPYSALSMLGTISQDRVFYRIVLGGETLTGYGDLPLPSEQPAIGAPTYDTLTFRGDEVRTVSVLRAVGPTTESRAVVVSIAQTRLGLETISQRITATATAVGIGFFLLATLLSIWASNAALRPIVRMTRTVAQRGPGDLRPVRSNPPTELAPLVDALNSFMARLNASLTRTEDFIAEAAHRVRTPLATVRAQAEVTHRKLSKPEHKTAIREMIRAIDESSRSAGQMLDHAMVTFRADALVQENLDLRALLDETCERLAPTADLKDIEIHRELPQTPIDFTGDGILLQAALQNVLDNAIKYSPEDSRITVSAEETTDLRLSIRDQGRGFAGEDVTKLTSRFNRGANAGDVVGSGLGLTIADEVARAHGGRLDIAENEEGVGACVSLILPRR